MCYYSYVINLAAKAFLFSNNPDAFKLKVKNAEKLKFEICYKHELLTL
jgi:hypothetical protein